MHPWISVVNSHKLYCAHAVQVQPYAMDSMLPLACQPLWIENAYAAVAACHGRRGGQGLLPKGALLYPGRFAMQAEPRGL